MSAKYAVNYRSLDSTSSSANSCDERALSSCEESMPSLPMQGGKGKSFFPVNGAEKLIVFAPSNLQTSHLDLE